MRDFIIGSQKDLEAAIEEFGILPFFANSIPGFSIEEHTAREIWFTDRPGPWEWKGPVIRNLGCAYGKFFEHKAAYVSREWFADFANYRRDGYDFDARYEDELASYRDNALYTLLEANAPVLSGELKRLGNYGKKGNKGFDTVMARLQAQCYCVISDFEYSRDKNGAEYGWGTALYSTPERFMGEDFTERVYARSPRASYERIFAHMKELFPEAEDHRIERFLSGGAGAGIRTGHRSWLIPSNPKLYDVVAGFADREEIEWTQSNRNIQPGDDVYIYVGMPMGAVRFRCEVLEVGIPWQSERGPKLLMRIRKKEAYPPDRMTRERMRDFGVVNCRGPRSVPEAMLRELDR